MVARIMHPAETYRRRAERAERDFENARDPKPNVSRRSRLNVGVNWWSLPSVRDGGRSDPAPLSRRQRGGPLRPSAGVPALLEGDPRLYQAAARTRRPLCGVARVHAQGHDPRQFGTLDEQEKASEKEPSNWRGTLLQHASPNPSTAHRTDRSSCVRSSLRSRQWSQSSQSIGFAIVVAYLAVRWRTV